MLLFLALGATRKQEKEAPVFPPILYIYLFYRPFNHEEDVVVAGGPRFLQLISIKEPRESYIAFSYDENGTDFFKMFMPQSALLSFAKKHYVTISPTEFDSAFKKKQHFTAMSEVFEIAMNPMDFISFFRRVLYGVSFAEYQSRYDIVLRRIEQECAEVSPSLLISKESTQALREIARLWWQSNMREMELPSES